MNTAITLYSRILLLFFLFFTCTALFAQNKYKIGDRVEASYAGDWQRARVVGGFEDNEREGTYEVEFDEGKHRSRINATYVRPLFRADENKKFVAGDRVEFKRWDDKIYEGEVIGTDGNKYQVKYTRDGFSTTEWVNEVLVRASKNIAANKKDAPQKNDPGKTDAWPGQRFKVGDRVMYDGVGFLATKAYGTIISVDAEKRLYTIKNENDASLRYTYACYEVVKPGEKINNDFFVGNWEVYVSGTFTTTEKDGKKSNTLTGGKKLPPLQIKADGTYTWTDVNKKVIRGIWKVREGVPGITLLKGMDGLDWTVYENTEAMATTAKTRDEIRFHHLPSSSGYYMAYRIGANKSCVLAGRKF